ncbi:MAG: type II toxin-antitoxin system HicA family toxin [Dehalococcoidia bacterium]|nr:type II toxin-antitoxin system HicA family toxin [Dehalococcoidia bacterium]
MPRLPPVRGNEVLRILLKAGFYIHHQRGSHARLFHRTKPELRVTIPVHRKELPERTLKSILRQANMTEEEFLRLKGD